jgi:hypothetical protein
VLEVAPHATGLHFGVLLSGAGAMDLTQPHFQEVGDEVPTTTRRLPDEPQALDFGVAS